MTKRWWFMRKNPGPQVSEDGRTPLERLADAMQACEAGAEEIRRLEERVSFEQRYYKEMLDAATRAAIENQKLERKIAILAIENEDMRKIIAFYQGRTPESQQYGWKEALDIAVDVLNQVSTIARAPVPKDHISMEAVHLKLWDALTEISEVWPIDEILVKPENP
jgi:hypothetical protein